MAAHLFIDLIWLTFTSLVYFRFANASPLLNHQIEDLPASSPSRNLHRRQGSAIPVTGIQEFGVHPRLELRELEQNEDQWNLYILGLARFQATNQTDDLSWYQIAGIHGRPYVPWDGVQPAAGVSNAGYCVHVLNIFLTWHRAYLALFEQTLFTHIVDAVNEFPIGNVRQRYAAAALSWRLPYWDWAAPPVSGQSVYPSSVITSTVAVTMPNGTNTIPNPLFAYNFHPVSEADFFYNPFSSWNWTMRYPTNWTEDAVSQNEQLAPILDNNRMSFMNRLYNLFTNYNNFTEFGNEAWENSGVSNADSLESIHDAIHSITGSNGHMTYFDYSAYDPLFFLHHAMIDRCFALWQALYNDSYVEPMADTEQTFTIPAGQIEDINSSLEPFYSDTSGNFWTSASLRSTKTLGYTYSDLGIGSVSAVKAAINNLYGSSAGSGAISRRQVSKNSSDGASAPEELTNGLYREYLANILTEKFALGGSYAIYIFIGDFDDNPSAWPIDPNLVGTHAVFAALSGADAASNLQVPGRQDGSSMLVTASMPLTSTLLARVQSGGLACMDPESVVPYLMENLNWRVATFDGSEVATNDVANLQITVVTAEVQPATAIDQFPTWHNFTQLTSVTQGKPGGC